MSSADLQVGCGVGLLARTLQSAARFAMECMG
jgi:hypothetical protein